ncbi:FtsQ-type POTRA domain-containing protein [Clostridium sp. CCUG 7971]|uniref:cell division protein FtsQ/DivIB n=1 Tax=Clostridium sp. CCUG 7971 TaxID=2811414 RepID=UPI001ABB5AF4|nr:FtsQ-type POTRA domain-containing protein [Clostridium sp. CCUG 7971]MBO3443270.1 FtsQ-type POTRA domain-containing protein [Clostridium sp. CCUG 7971]
MKKKKKKRVNASNLMILLSFLLMITIGMYSILNSSLFNTNKVEIEGNKKIKKNEILKDLDIRKDKNIFMYDMGKMEKIVLRNPYVETVQVKRKLPDKLQILIKEKEIYAIIKDKDDYCYIDKEGNYIEKIKEISDKESSPIVDIDYTIDENNNIEFKNEDTKKGLLYLLECMKENNLYKKIVKVNYSKDDIINMYTKDDIKIILGNDKDLDYNISRMSYIISDLQDDIKRKGTIDLTYGNYAVYKP